MRRRILEQTLIAVAGLMLGAAIGHAKAADYYYEPPPPQPAPVIVTQPPAIVIEHEHGCHVGTVTDFDSILGAETRVVQTCY